MGAIFTLAIVLIASWTGPAGAGATPAEKCKASKLRAAGKMAECRAKEGAKTILGGAGPLRRCNVKFNADFARAEAKAGPHGCTTKGDAVTVGHFIDATTDAIEASLAGARFVDNGDGTVTDTQTGLTWEKKTDDGGIHDKDNEYTLSDHYPDPSNSGTAFSVFLATLNCDGSSHPGFAGHRDWRIPSVTELQTILLEPYPCGTKPCIDPVFGPTKATLFWTSTPDSAGTSGFYVDFNTGIVSPDAPRSAALVVRAVRGGS